MKDCVNKMRFLMFLAELHITNFNKHSWVKDEKVVPLSRL